MKTPVLFVVFGRFAQMGCPPLRAGGADAVSVLGPGEARRCHGPLCARVPDVEALGEIRHDDADHGCLHGRRPPDHVHGE